MYRMPWQLSPISGVRYCSLPIQKATNKKKPFFSKALKSKFRLDSIVCGIARIIFMYRMPWQLSPIAGVRYCSLPIQKATSKKKTIFFKSFKIKIPLRQHCLWHRQDHFYVSHAMVAVANLWGTLLLTALFRRQHKKNHFFSKALKSKFRLRQHCLWHRQDHFYVSHAMVAVANRRGTLLLNAYSEGNYKKKPFFFKSFKIKIPLRQHCLWHRQDHFYVSHAMVSVANRRGTLLLTAYSEGNQQKKTIFFQKL